MKLTLYRQIIVLIGCLIGLFMFPLVVAQSVTPPVLPFCGTPSLTPAQSLSLGQLARLALQRKRASGAAPTAITYVPIRPHIVRRSDGSADFNLTRLNQIMAVTNSYYLLNGFGIQFYFAGTTPDYIDDDDLYNVFPFPEGNTVDGRDATDALNQYYVTHFTNPGVGGFARFPLDDIVTTRSFIGTNGGDADLGNRLIPHELGHTFSVLHTFGYSNGEYPTDELVTRGAGANCTTAGDEICDTPADPYHIAGAYVTDVNGCPQYNPGSTARDANGDLYAPSITNIMSYYFPCTHDFTPGQYDRMQAGLALRQTHTSYSLSHPPTNVVSPNNVAVSLNGIAITITWQDNATNEMGYFVERSTTSATEGFVPVGGVGPDETTFVDYDTRLRMHYYYRIRPSNSTTGSLSPTADIATPRTTDPVIGLTTTNITANTAQLNWNSLGDNVTYDVQWRSIGSTSWNEQVRLPQTSITISSLSGSTSFEWRVKASDQDTYSGPVTFTTLCPMPATYSFGVIPARVSAAISWNAFSPASILQWRAVGSATWNTSSTITNTSSYTLTGLTSDTQYEWRVQGVCSATATSEFTDPLTFTTYACVSPQYLSSTPRAESANLSWYMPYYESGRTFSVRYRPVGTTNWTTVSSLTTTTCSLTGLANNTTYEWQAKSVCSVTDESAYSLSSTFTTYCPAVPIGLSSMPTAIGVTLGWVNANALESGSTVELQYRPVGNPTWNLITETARYGYSSRQLTGLMPNTTHEWRVRIACSSTAQSDFTATMTFTTGCYAPSSNYLSTDLISSSSARLNWYNSTDPGTQYDLRYRAVGEANWVTISNVSSATTGGNYSISGLTNQTTYEWQIRTVCSPTESSTFSTGPNFSTLCKSPDYLTQTALVTSALLSWGQAGIDVSYEVFYRLAGTSTWTTLSNLTSTNTVISGLTGNTSYEWQVRSQCTNGINAAPSGINTFTTYACSTPYSLNVTNLTMTAARLNWSFANADAGTRYEGRYRVVGATDWITLSNLSSDQGQGYFDLFGLAIDTQYEWQIQTRCSATESSAFTSSNTFKTLPVCTGMYTVKTGLWSDPSVWSCGRLPLSTDPVQIKHLVTVPGNYLGTVLRITYDAGQKLQFNFGSRIKMGQ
jgi:hypothetical protein